MIPQSFIQDLLNRVDIVDVVDRHVKLKRAGANYVACCPFHSEKTPSFTVSSTKQFYHCFGCGAHGTAVGFLMEYSGLGFVEAVKDLAQSVGMKVPEVRSERAHSKVEAGGDMYSVLLKVAQYYRAQLKSAPQAIDYLKGRGLSGEIAKHFGVGYAPDGWQNLATVFPDYDSNVLVGAGLVIQGEGGKRYDRFRDRIIFPIVDIRGNVIGFGGRVLGEGEPKYLNSPETPVFEKGRELYGLYQARRAIRDAGKVIVVEGYMDVIGLAQYGVEYAVATLGTAATAFHIQKLLRQSDDVVFCFDGDEAGQRAAWRALENSLGQLVDGKQVSFLFLPQNEDPDTYVRKCAKDEVWKSVPLSEFLLNELKARVDFNTQEGRAKLLQDAKPLIKQITAPLLSLLLRKQLAGLVGITQQELDGQFQIKPQLASAPPRSVPPAQRSITRTVTELLMVEPTLAKLAARSDLAHGFGLPGVEQAELKALDQLLDAFAHGLKLVSIGEYFRGTEHENLLRTIEADVLRWQDKGLGAQELEAEFGGAWQQLVDRIRRARIGELLEKARSQGLSPEDQAQYRLLQQAVTAQLSK